jgi:hypothetical protein
LGQPSENIFNVYPNPTDGTLNIEMLDFKKVIIFNFSGQEVFRSKESRIDISVLKKGAYIVRLEDQNGASINTKLIKD